MYVARPLVKLQTLQFIREFILERSHTNAMYVARRLVILQTLLFIADFILGRNHINVMYVAWPLMKLQSLQFIRDSIQDDQLAGALSPQGPQGSGSWVTGLRPS